jgi:hypothetical protein
MQQKQYLEGKRFKTNKLAFYLSKLEKEQNKPKLSRKKKITKIKTQINETKARKIIGTKKQNKNSFFEKHQQN